jgi:glycosyltransferase involved in cell wall biosynthesis
LSPDTYFKLMSEADVVLLPYSLDYYGHCSSGVFAEAAALGKVIVVPEGTVAARQGREFGLGLVAAKAPMAEALAEAIAEAARNWDALNRQARASAGAFREAQSVKTFWTRLLAALGGRAAAAA